MTTDAASRASATLAETVDGRHFHPLEMIPFFRRWPCSFRRDLAYTFIWNCSFALFFYGMNVMFSDRGANVGTFLGYLIVSQVIGYSIHAFFGVGAALGLEKRARHAGFVAKVLYYSGVPLAGVFVGFAVASIFMDVGFRGWTTSPEWVLSIVFLSLVVSTILSTVFFWRERTAVAEAVLARERERGERIEREAALANLRALQAQIEPHFLFNTLANVQHLVESDPPEASRMLESLIQYLRAALPQMRESSTSLKREVDMARAFLEIQRIRMGARLDFAIDVPESLQCRSFPPMMLISLVENAVKHGVDPCCETGTIAIRAAEAGGVLRVWVEDSGEGIKPKKGGGVGLSNIRDRLKALYGTSARLVIEEREPRGVVASIEVPAGIPA
ncbi:MAG TPA: histidine kinase [Usitatibacter sp.]|nr:histidine kinase [Usitatibacter sp.]